MRCNIAIHATNLIIYVKFHVNCGIVFMKDVRSRQGNVAFIRVSAITPLIQQFDKRQETARVLLSRHGIMQSLLEDPYAVVPLQRFVAFFEDAAAALESPFFGAKLGAVFKPADIGPMGMLFSLSPTIKDAFERIAKFVNSVQNATTSSIVQDNDSFIWSYRLADQSIWPRRQDAEYSLAASCQLVRSSFRANWRPQEIHFEHDMPENAEVLSRIFKAPVLFKQSSNRIIMSVEEATRSYRNENKELAMMLERHIGDMISEFDMEQSLASKVRSLIELYVGRRPVTINFLADELGMNPRSLQRQLQREGVSVRSLTRVYRQELAVNLLSARKATVSDVAEALGYADSAVFGRAFKDWTGHPPTHKGH